MDCSGSFADDADVPLAIPWVNPEVLTPPPLRGVVSTPGAAATLLASVLGPLWRAGLSGPITATVLLPASMAGRAGIDELSRQVVALFNSATPPRKVFDQGLAFDLLPEIGAVSLLGWTDEEERVVVELARLRGSRVHAAVSLVGVPVFSGISASIQIRPNEVPSPEGIARILEQGGVQIPKGGSRQIPRPRKVDGQPFAQVGRIRADQETGIHLWASMDNLRGCAAVAVAACGVLLKSRG